MSYRQIDILKLYYNNIGTSGLKFTCTSTSTYSVNYATNKIGQKVANPHATYTGLGIMEVLKNLFSKELVKVASKSALTYTASGIGIIANLIQYGLEWKGYKKTGKAVGLLGNVAAGAVVGGISGGPIGAVVGGVGALVAWGIGEIIGGIIDWLF